MAEISAKVGEDTSICSVYIKNLITLGIIRKESPYGEKSSRRTIYSIEDNMFRFWYRFVPENNSIIARGAVDLAYKRIEPNLPRYMGHVFEDICTQYLWSLLLHGKSPVDFSEIGRWWGTDPRTKAKPKSTLWQNRIDISRSSANVNGQTKRSISMCWKRLSNAAIFSTMSKITSICLQKPVSQEAAWKRPPCWAMSHSSPMPIF